MEQKIFNSLKSKWIQGEWKRICCKNNQSKYEKQVENSSKMLFWHIWVYSQKNIPSLKNKEIGDELGGEETAEICT